MLGTTLDAKAYLHRLRVELGRIDAAAVERWADFVFDVWTRGSTLHLIGNGGSAAAASHLSVDLGKGTVAADNLRDESHRRLRVVSLTDNVPWITGGERGQDGRALVVRNDRARTRQVTMGAGTVVTAAAVEAAAAATALPLPPPSWLRTGPVRRAGSRSSPRQGGPRLT